MTAVDYLLGALAGLAYGAMIGFLKYYFLWRPALTPKWQQKPQEALPLRSGLSMFANIFTLLSIYFLRRLLPFSFEMMLIMAAVTLSFFSKLPTIHSLRAGKKQSASTDASKE